MHKYYSSTGWSVCLRYGTLYLSTRLTSSLTAHSVLIQPSSTSRNRIKSKKVTYIVIILLYLSVLKERHFTHEAWKLILLLLLFSLLLHPWTQVVSLLFALIILLDNYFLLLFTWILILSVNLLIQCCHPVVWIWISIFLLCSLRVLFLRTASFRRGLCCSRMPLMVILWSSSRRSASVSRSLLLREFPRRSSLGSLILAHPMLVEYLIAFVIQNTWLCCVNHSLWVLVFKLYLQLRNILRKVNDVGIFKRYSQLGNYSLLRYLPSNALLCKVVHWTEYYKQIGDYWDSDYLPISKCSLPSSNNSPLVWGSYA